MIFGWCASVLPRFFAAPRKISKKLGKTSAHTPRNEWQQRTEWQQSEKKGQIVPTMVDHQMVQSEIATHFY